MKKITILIPVFNELNTLEKILQQVESVDFCGLDKEIILVDDFSTDGTRKLYSKITHKVIYHDENKGKGAALRTGIEAASGDIIIIQDADLEYNPIDYVPLVELIKSNKADVVYGSRFADGRNSENFLFLSFLANKFLTFMTRILYNAKITDMETCYKAFRADIIKKIEIKSNRFDFEPEITAKILKKGVRFRELPISYNARTTEAGKKITWRDGVQAVWTLLREKFN